MTGMWETALAKIEAGSMDADTFPEGHRGVRNANHRRTAIGAAICRYW